MLGCKRPTGHSLYTPSTCQPLCEKFEKEKERGAGGGKHVTTDTGELRGVEEVMTFKGKHDKGIKKNRQGG